MSELRQKLLRHARALVIQAQAQTVAAPGASAVATPGEQAEPVAAQPEQLVEEALAWLQSQGYLSDSRFAQSRVHVRSSRFGNLRIQQELSQHQVVITPELQQALVASELSRARSVQQRKFGDTPACSLADRAKQTRFLMQRGFSSEVIRRVVGRTPVADSESTDTDV